MQSRIEAFIAIVMREAGMSAVNAIGEVREAIDRLRYYAAQGTLGPLHVPLGTVICISPWNFPLAIFIATRRPRWSPATRWLPSLWKRPRSSRMKA